MNSISQFDAHPDAESLNGFVENALPAAERADLMAHLAACGRCREVVFLAQNAARAPEPRAAAAAAPIAGDVRPEVSWWRRWRVMLIPATAMAILVWVAVLIQSNRSAPPDEVAKMSLAPDRIATAATPTQPPATTEPAAKQAPKPGEPVTIEPPMQARNLARIPSGAVRPPASAHAVSAPVQATPTASADSLAQANGQAKTAPAPRQFAGESVAPGYFRSGPSAQQQPAQMEGLAGGVSGAAQRAKAPAQNFSASETVTVDADKVLPEPAPAPPHNVQLDAVETLPLNNAAAKKSGLTMLPSGLPMISTVAAGHTTLALDAMGSLFVSHDIGGKWERVEGRWKGRATKVRLAQPEPSATAQAEAESAKKVDAAVALFELVTDTNAVWTSADGKTWNAR